MMNWPDLLSNKRYAQPHKSADIRSSFQRDYDRIIFSSPFRRLQNKTQVFPLPGAQMVHNRLTHSLEVASVGRSIACRTVEKLAKKHPELKEHQSDIETIVASACLAHDLGNPPFGHSGEDTISSFFKDGKGKELENLVLPEQWSDLIAFEGNANAFRQLTHQFTGRRAGGFSLTSATLATLLKYPYPSYNKGNRKKYNVFYSEIEAFKEVVEECGIPRLDAEHLVYARHPLSYMMEASDDICYLVLDMEDANKRGIISTEAIENCFLSFFSTEKDKEFYKHKEQVYKEVSDTNERMAFLRAMLINKLVKASKQTGIKTVAIAGGVSANSGLHDAMLRLGEKYHWKVFIPRLSYSTDNAAMVAVAGYFKFLKGEFASQDLVPYARQSLKE